MPDIPRIYTAIAEWAACMIFITSLKKRYTGWTTGGIVIGLLIVQCLFLVTTGNVPIFFWIPCMIIAVMLMIGFIYFCCDISGCRIFWHDRICCSGIYGITGMADNVYDLDEKTVRENDRGIRPCCYI